MNTFLNDWGLSVITFLPLVGAAVMMLDPQGARSAHKLVALVTLAGGRWSWASGCCSSSTTTGPATLQFQIDRKWIELINSRFTMGVDGIVPAAARR